MKRFLPALAGAVAVSLAPVAVSAQNTLFQGFASGCFTADAGCVQGDSDTQVKNLVYTASGFTSQEYHEDDFATGVGGFDPANNFGTFSLGVANYLAPPQTYTETFTLWLAFTSPTANTATFNASVTGTVAVVNNGVTVMFNSPTEFSWSDGSFDYLVGVNNLGVTATTGGATLAELTGYVKATPIATVPEPMSVLLMGTGLLGLAAYARRRKQNGDVENI